MQVEKIEFNLFQLLFNLSKSLDFNNQGLMNHHKQVALISLRLGQAAGMPRDALNELFKAAIIHDAGAVTWREKEKLALFEPEDAWDHCWRGYDFVSGVPAIGSVANILLSHHDRWAGGNPSGLSRDDIPLASRIIHLADRVDVLIKPDVFILEQQDHINSLLQKYSGQVFDPDLVVLFYDLSKREDFWFDLTWPWVTDQVLQMIPDQNVTVDLKDLLALAQLFARVVDAKSPFTSSHSRGVAHICSLLANQAGLTEKESILLEIAGLLHDLGKLAVPEEIIEKPGRLTPSEYNLIKQHAYYTYWLLKPIAANIPLPEWAAYHHERLDGLGYPFRRTASELDLPARIVAVADLFTALREERPYRPGLSWPETEKIINRQVAAGALDPEMVDLLFSCRTELDGDCRIPLNNSLRV